MRESVILSEAKDLNRSAASKSCDKEPFGVREPGSRFSDVSHVASGQVLWTTFRNLGNM